MKRKGTGLGAASVIALVALALVPLVGAQSGSVPVQLAGTWTVEGSTARAMRVVEGAFEPAVQTMPELFRGFARDRVRSSMEPPRRIVVTLEGSRVRVAFERTDPSTVDGSLGGTAAATGVDDGTTVTTRLSGGWLEIVYVGSGSEMRQLLSTEADGSRMHLDYAIESTQLPFPVRYRLEYVRPSP
jgi:hypothetical protein